MTILDWVVLAITILTIVAYGVVASRKTKTVDTYLRGHRELGWMTVGLSVMATQASAITFLSTPGQGFEEGMGLVQMYFGMPLAMIVVCAVFVPIYYRLQVYTAYEYLGQRFDARMRTVGALLFLTSRGLAAGITIYAPSIILATVLGWPIDILNLVIGVLVIIYTVSGGTTAVSRTQKQQMVVIMTGMFIAFGVLASLLPSELSLGDAAAVAGALGRLNMVEPSFSFESRYNLFSGLVGGFFLALSYFGTDQSQVQRYLAGRSSAQSRLGLLFNGFVKVPMQAFILFLGVLLFVYHIYQPAPVFMDEGSWRSLPAEQRSATEEAYMQAVLDRKGSAKAFIEARKAKQDTAVLKAELVKSQREVDVLRKKAKAILKASGHRDTEDADYVFIRFVLNALPSGLVGLLLAVILSAAMSSTASELNALGTTSMVDLWKPAFGDPSSESRGILLSKALTAGWGVVALIFASSASLFDNLIEAVNRIGSIFYGTVLGIFVVAFFFPRVQGKAVFVGAVVAQVIILGLFFFSSLGFLWFNVFGCIVVATVSVVFQGVFNQREGSH